MLGELGKICAAIPVKNIDYALDQAGIAIRDGAELIEWRLDLNEETPYNPYADIRLYQRLHKVDIKAITTCMTKAEGGNFSGSDEELAVILNGPIHNGTDYITAGLEFARTKLGAEVIERAKNLNVKVIVSKHGQKMPETAEIIKIFEEEKALGADIAKAAFRAENLDDVKKMKEAAWHDLGIPNIAIAIAMGEPGKLWRVISLLRCNLNYFAVGEATAPGQLSVREGVVYRDLLQDVFYKIH